MVEALRLNRGAWLSAGILLGLIAGALLPQAPLHAVATDRQENFCIATGWLDTEVEAVFFLDFLTGDLKAAALGPNTFHFNYHFQTNILQDLGVDVSKNPKYLMVTGGAQFRRKGGQIQPANSVVYVAELTTGKLAAYGIPWSTAARNANQRFDGPLTLLDVKQFRTAVVRDN